MSEPARRTQPLVTEAPRLDPVAVRRAYRQERARRRARLQRTQDSRLATFRFWLVVLVLLALTGVFGFTVVREIQRLFGL